MKTIAIDARVLTVGQASGIREYTEQLLTHMLPLDGSLKFKVFTAGAGALPPASWRELPQVSEHNIATSGRLLLMRTLLTGRPRIDRLVGGADAVFFPHFLLGATARGVRRIMTWHDLSYELFPQYLSMSRIIWHRLQMRPQFQAHSADALIAVSHATASDLEREYRIPSERIHVVHSGIAPDIRRVDPLAAARWRADRGIPEQYVLMLGTREPRKNIEGGIAAWSAARARSGADIPLVIAGPSGWLEPDIRRCVRSAQDRERLFVIGSVPAADRALLMSGALALLYPSFMEGFGFPPLEAMACGVPVVASANSSIAEVCGDAALLVSPYRVSSIATALMELLTDRALAGRLVSRGYERAARYSWDKTAQRTLSVIVDSL
jgi:glycosyltransferase involved in cell wall biosynthesis